MVRLGTAYTPISWNPEYLAIEAREVAKDCSWAVVPLGEQDIALHAQDLSMITSTFHDAGVEVGFSPWGVAKLFGGEPPSAVGHLCPKSCAVERVLNDWATAVIAAQPDFVLFDEMRERCCDILWPFAQRFLEAELKLHAYWNPDIASFPVKIAHSCSVFGIDLYPPTETTQRLQLLQAHTKDMSSESCAWIRAFRVSTKDEHLAEAALKAALDANVDRIAIWSWAAGQCCAALRSERPAVLWNQLAAQKR